MGRNNRGGGFDRGCEQSAGEAWDGGSAGFRWERGGSCARAPDGEEVVGIGEGKDCAGSVFGLEGSCEAGARGAFGSASTRREVVLVVLVVVVVGF